MYNLCKNRRFATIKRKQNKVALMQGFQLVHCVPLWSMSFNLLPSSSLNCAIRFVFLWLSSLTSLSLVSLSSSLSYRLRHKARLNTKRSTRERSLVKAVVRQLVGRETWLKRYGGQDPKYPLDLLSFMKCKTEHWTFRQCLVSQISILIGSTNKIIVVQSQYGIYVQIIITSDTK